MTAAQIRSAAVWLRHRAEQQGMREADAIRDRLRQRQRVAEQPRDARGRWKERDADRAA